MRFLNRISELLLFYQYRFHPPLYSNLYSLMGGRAVPTAQASQRARSEMFLKPSVNSQRIRNKAIRQRVRE
jgi:hypothetical protein